MEANVAMSLVAGNSLLELRLMPLRVGKNSIAFALSLDMALMFVLVGAIIERLVSVAVSL